MAHPARAFARPALTGLLLGLAVAGIFTEPFTSLAFGVADVGLRFSWWALFPLLSIGLALFAAYCAFGLRNPGLTGIAIVAALVHLSRFYYMYGTTLAWKSLIMLVAGVALIAASVVLGRRAGRAS
jgi:hypothetical protein